MHGMLASQKEILLLFSFFFFHLNTFGILCFNLCRYILRFSSDFSIEYIQDFTFHFTWVDSENVFVIFSNWTYPGFNVYIPRRFRQDPSEAASGGASYDDKTIWFARVSFRAGSIITIPLKLLNLRRLIKIEESERPLIPIIARRNSCRKRNEDSIRFAESRWNGGRGSRDLLWILPRSLRPFAFFLYGRSSHLRAYKEEEGEEEGEREGKEKKLLSHFARDAITAG